jgi:fibronectin type III domain protein
MLRRAAVLACLLAPLAARAQTATLTVSPTTTFGKADCVVAGDAADPAISLSWTVVPPSGSVPGAGWEYKVKALPSGGNCTSENTDTYQLNQSTLSWVSNTSSYPGTTSETLFLSDLVATAGLSCSASLDQRVVLCVQLFNGTTISTVVSQEVTIQLAAPVAPKGVTVTPGDTALNVAWGSVTTTPAADRYRVTASTVTCDPVPALLTPACLGAVAATATTSGTSLRLGGLTNLTTYGVQVYAISTGGNESPASSPPVAGTPADVRDFWDEYKSAQGVEEGGCGGGPAGLVSLLAVAGLALSLRRRS